MTCVRVHLSTDGNIVTKCLSFVIQSHYSITFNLIGILTFLGFDPSESNPIGSNSLSFAFAFPSSQLVGS
jgi:hypothetical protein